MEGFEYYYAQYWNDIGDPRYHKSLLFSGGPWKVFAFVLTYLIGVTIVGPYIMRRRKPIEGLLWPIRIYNAFMVVFNTYLFLKFGQLLNWGLDSWGCGKAMQRFPQKEIYPFELMLLSRYFDFVDSIFFVCRKKFDHLSLLHVAHHSLVPIIVWFTCKTAGIPFLIFPLFINFGVHIVMYAYYCLSTFSSLRKHLWWKKYITSMQIVQFCIHLVHSLQLVYYPYCYYSRIVYVELAFAVSFLYLFYDFYKRSYSSKQRQQQHQDQLQRQHQEREQAISEGDSSDSCSEADAKLWTNQDTSRQVDSDTEKMLTRLCSSVLEGRSRKKLRFRRSQPR